MTHKINLLMILSLCIKIFLFRMWVFPAPSLGGTISEWLVFVILGFILLSNRYALLTLNLFIGIVLTCMVVYHSHYGVIPTLHALGQSSQVGSVLDTILVIWKPEYFLFLADIPLWILLVASERLIRSRKSKLELKITKPTVLALMGLFLLIQSTTWETDYIDTKAIANDRGLWSYEWQKTLPMFNTADSSESLLNNVQNEAHPYFGSEKEKNIIVIQLESFQNFPIGRTLDGVEITPVLNALKQESHYFPNTYQTIGPGNTSDAEFAVNTGLYPLGDKAMSSSITNDSIPSLPRDLKRLGYSSYTFHTNTATYWERDQMYNALGFDRYYDNEFFGNEDVIAFGASDEVLYRKTSEEIAHKVQRGEKVYAHIIAQSSHHPFRLPDNKINLDLPEGYKDTELGNYLEAIHYADEALGLFIEELKQNGLWEESVVFIYGDHIGVNMDAPEDQQHFIELTGNAYNRVIDGFNVPLFIRMPNDEGNVEHNTLVGQLDLHPTVLHLLGENLSSYALAGKNIFSPDIPDPLPLRFYAPEGSFVTQDYAFIAGRTFEDSQVIDRQTRTRIPTSEAQTDYIRAKQLGERSDAFLNKILNQDVNH